MQKQFRYFLWTLLILLLIQPEQSRAQNYREQMKLIRLKPNNVVVYGRIADYTGEKLSGAHISLFDPQSLSVVETIPIDGAGEYLFTLEQGKTVGFLIEKDGYFPYYHEFTVPAETKEQLEFNMALPDGIRNEYLLIYGPESKIPSNVSLLEELISLLLNQTGLSIWIPNQENPLGTARNNFIDSLFQSRGIEAYRLISGSLPRNTDQIVQINFITDPEANTVSEADYQGSEAQTATGGDAQWTLQFAASKNELSERDLRNLKSVKVFKGKDGFYRYCYGTFNSRQEANQAINLLRDKGFNQAFPKLIGNLKKL